MHDAAHGGFGVAREMLGENAGVGKGGGVIGPFDAESPSARATWAFEGFFGAGGNHFGGGDHQDGVKVGGLDRPKVFRANKELDGNGGNSCGAEQAAVDDGEGAEFASFILSTCCGFRWGQEDSGDEDGQSEYGQEIAAEEADGQDYESGAEETHDGAEDGPGIFVAAEVESFGGEEGDGESGADYGLAKLGGEAVGERRFGGG